MALRHPFSFVILSHHWHIAKFYYAHDESLVPDNHWFLAPWKAYGRGEDSEFIACLRRLEGVQLEAFAAEIRDRITLCDPVWLDDYAKTNDDCADLVAARCMQLQLDTGASASSRARTTPEIL